MDGPKGPSTFNTSVAVQSQIFKRYFFLFLQKMAPSQRESKELSNDMSHDS